MSSAGRDTVVVIGGGLVGLATAFELRRRGIDVAVIEPNDPGSGASSGNAGSVSPGGVMPVAYPGLWRDLPRMLADPTGPLRITPAGALLGAPWLARFLLASRPEAVRRSAAGIAPLLGTALDAHRDLSRAIGTDDLLEATGQLQLYPDRAAFEKDAFGWALRREHGVEFHELRREEIAQYEPAIGPAYGFGVFLPKAGLVADPGGLGQRLAAHLVRDGVRFERDEAVGLESDGPSVTAVAGRRGRYPCRAVVLAAGAWSTRLVRRLGYRIPLLNQRGYHLQFADPGVAPRRVVTATDRKIFISPMRGGLRVAGTVEIAPLGTRPDMRRARHLEAGLRAVFPNLRPGEATSEWSGERPCLPDSLPVMGRADRHRNLWFNFGHGHLGLTFAPAAARAVVHAMETGEDAALAPFAHRRFG